MRFEVSRVLDAIEQHLTTDPVLAQAVVDVAEMARFSALDGGRGVNLVRLGMVVDALGRYLRDGGSYLFPVAPRPLLSDSELTSKERMVLGRWTDEGLIEATESDPAERAAEIAELTGLPMISLVGHVDLARRYPFLRDAPHRVLTVTARFGAALLTDGTGGTGGVLPFGGDGAAAGGAGAGAATAAAAAGSEGPAAAGSGGTGQPAAGSGDTDQPATGSVENEGLERVVGRAVAVNRIDPPADGVRRRGLEIPVWPDPMKQFVQLFPEPVSMPVTPSALGASLAARRWRCAGFDCPCFGDGRQSGQPIPHLQKGIAVCPRHGEPLTDIGPRPPALAVALIIDGLRRRRFLVGAERPVLVGRHPEDPEDIDVATWLHEAAADWISPVHARLEVVGGELVVINLADNGSLVWVRTDPQARPDTRRLGKDESHVLGEWDTVELYTGIELGRGDRRPRGVEISAAETSSVLVDAPTAAMRQHAPS